MFDGMQHVGRFTRITLAGEQNVLRFLVVKDVLISAICDGVNVRCIVGARFALILRMILEDIDVRQFKRAFAILRIPYLSSVNIVILVGI